MRPPRADPRLDRRADERADAGRGRIRRARSRGGACRSSSGTSRSEVAVEPEQVDRDEADDVVRPNDARGELRPRAASAVSMARLRRSPTNELDRRLLVGPRPVTVTAALGRLLGQEAIDDEPVAQATVGAARPTIVVEVVDRMPASSTRTAPAASTAARTRTPAHSGSMIGSSISRRGDPCRRSGAAGSRGALVADGRRRARSCAIVASYPSTPDYHRAGDERRGPQRSRDRVRRARGLAGLTPTGRAVVPGLVGAVRLREHDLLVRGRVRGDRALPRQRPPVRRARRQPRCLSIAIVISVGINALVSPILGAFSDRGGRRMPFLLFFTRAVHRRDVLHRRRAAGRSALVLFIVANFAYQAALIYYDATLKTGQLPGDPRQAVRASGPGSATAGRSSSGC